MRRTVVPSQNSAMARSSVSLTSPTLPPSAISASAIALSFALSLALAPDRDADIVEGRGDRGVRLVDRDADRRHLAETFEHRIGHRAGRGLDQPVTLGAEGFARHHHHLIVAHGVD